MGDAHIHLADRPGELERILSACDTLGIDAVCLSACGPAFGQPGNEAVRDGFRRHSRRVFGFGYIKLGQDTPDTVRRLHGEGFSGLKVINPAADYDDDSFLPVYEEAARSGMPILFHTGVVAMSRDDSGMDVSSERVRPIRVSPDGGKRAPSPPFMRRCSSTSRERQVSRRGSCGAA